MNITHSSIPDVLIIEPKVIEDKRGFFYESFRQDIFEKAIKRKIHFLQQNTSVSVKGTLRGLHFQSHPFAQGKLIWVNEGEIFDVAVDIRPSSPTFGKYVAEILSSKNKKQMWIPQGFAHGFLTLSDRANVFYQTDKYYQVDSEICIAWNDPTINIDWPKLPNIIISPKDFLGQSFESSPLFSYQP
jgi:dTDP-4-dehydrorhamnose 3,5-epimerase